MPLPSEEYAAREYLTRVVASECLFTEDGDHHCSLPLDHDGDHQKPRRKPVHQCEEWQMQEHAQGGRYCAACGKREGGA